MINYKNTVCYFCVGIISNCIPVPTRRGDLEILIYNLIQWLGCTLPWENNIKDPMAVKASKEKYMADIPLFMKTCFGSKTPPGIFKI